MRIEKLRLDRAITASFAPELTLSSLMGKMSAGIPNPCGYINKLGTDGDHRPRPGPRPMVTAPGPRVGNNHYGCSTIRKARPWDPRVKAMKRAASAADGGRCAAEGDRCTAADGSRCAAATKKCPAKPAL